jgi:hypothetical protein
MPNYVFLVIIILHIALALLFILNPFSKLRYRKEYWLPVLLVPLFGPFIALTIEILFRSDDPGTLPTDLETLKLPSDIFWSQFNPVEENRDVVPLEEAILINNTEVRRKAMRDTFRDEAIDLMDVLMVARSNEDVDTTHYATIQISKSQRSFQLKLQGYAAAIKQDPENDALLDEYIELMEQYLNSPLPEDSVMLHQRRVFADLLDLKLTKVKNDRSTLVRKLRIWTDLKENYASVVEVMDVLKKNWPQDEKTWLEILRACVEWKDGYKMRMVGEEMKSAKVQWTRGGREMARFWVQQ